MLEWMTRPARGWMRRVCCLSVAGNESTYKMEALIVSAIMTQVVPGVQGGVDVLPEYEIYLCELLMSPCRSTTDSTASSMLVPRFLSAFEPNPRLFRKSPGWSSAVEKSTETPNFCPWLLVCIICISSAYFVLVAPNWKNNHPQTTYRMLGGRHE